VKTIADVLREEGAERARAEFQERLDATERARAEAEISVRAITVGKQLRLKFGPLPDAVTERLARASAAESLERFGLAERSGDAARAIHTLLDAGVLDQRAVSVIGFAAEALSQSHARPAEPTGVLTVLTALRDPDVSRAVAFGLAFARRFGARLATSHATV
jgi:hypothetical protein